ncbi:hypothetical protein [Aureliella helgolandensis]|uniref:Uncharacterized protein n=1 Tax=Aureliella helgolandensis TaxID=2527968 RepID=A0A518G9J6_9BACT|nr:hypothetical protein [Aureliella helgolandensis]QDV25243.1 hypothetical protein Q31a_35660 [Aureliella helgolandensis]
MEVLKLRLPSPSSPHANAYTARIIGQIKNLKDLLSVYEATCFLTTYFNHDSIPLVFLR